MVSRLERWAEDARRDGYYGVAPDISKKIKAEGFRKTGMVEYFPQEATSTDSSIGDRTNEFHDLRILREKLIEVLFIHRGKPCKPVLTGELAGSINMGIGQYLEDDVLIRDLILPSTDKYQRNKRQTFSTEGFERFEQVNLPVKIVYNRALVTLIRRGYRCIGEIRNADLFVMLQERNIGKTTLNFVKTAFARPQAEKQ